MRKKKHRDDKRELKWKLHRYKKSERKRDIVWKRNKETQRERHMQSEIDKVQDIERVGKVGVRTG